MGMVPWSWLSSWDGVGIGIGVGLGLMGWDRDLRGWDGARWLREWDVVGIGLEGLVWARGSGRLVGPWMRKVLDVGLDKGLCEWDGTMKIHKWRPVIVIQ